MENGKTEMPLIPLREASKLSNCTLNIFVDIESSWHIKAFRTAGDNVTLCISESICLDDPLNARMVTLSPADAEALSNDLIRLIKEIYPPIF